MTCIFTVIKNEHLYLEEWISYHINLGIDHIFIFQDIDSNDHSYITNKYSQVTLSNISDILDDKEMSQVRYTRQTGNSNPQFIYIRKGLLYIKNNFNYEWCFVIDVDEFITTDNINSIDLYKDYDAVILQWKCYGANGLIDRDYTKPLIDTFTQEITGYVPTVTLESYTKTCYNLITYQPNYFKYTHQPSNSCNFCRTDFSKDRTKPIYDNIYLRHYITKSWSEYVNKVIARGYLYGKTRTLDFFFKVNPDMNHLKDKLIEDIYNRTLVVLAYKNSSAQGKELEYCLKLWKKYCTFSYHFVVIGDYNNELISKYQWVEFIYKDTIRPVPDQYSPHLDIQSKMEYVYNKYKDTYNGFIWIADDNYAIKPFTLKDITTVHYHSICYSAVNVPKSFWIYDKQKTIEILKSNNLPTINYTTHVPCYFEFSKLKTIWDKYNMRTESYVIEDLYYNTYNTDEPVIDTDFRIAVISPTSTIDLTHSHQFMFNSPRGWSSLLQSTLESLIESV